jgi:hypothetical protein
MIVELEDGTTVSFRGGAVRINGVPEGDNQKAVLDLIVEGSFAEAQEKYECASEETLEVHGVEGAKIFPADHFDKADLKKRAEQELKKHQED